MNQKMETQINGISRDEFLENIESVAKELVEKLEALKNPNDIAVLCQEVTSGPIVTNRFVIENLEGNCYRKEGFEVIATLQHCYDNFFQLAITKGLEESSFKNSSASKLDDFYLFGLISPFGRFHGYIQKESANGSHEQDSWKGVFLEIQSVCEPTSNSAHTK